MNPETLRHIPVLFNEVFEGLDLKEGDVVLDATLGGGGHSEEICRRIGEMGTLVGFDRDEDAVERVEIRLENVPLKKLLRVANFKDIKKELAALEIPELNAALFDLGLSSFQLEVSGRGFSFERDEPLLMTFEKEKNEGATALDVINNYKEEDLKRIFSENGERYSGRIARVIVEARRNKKFSTTKELVSVIEGVVKGRGKIHPATLVFQALRMEVNDELESLREGLVGAWDALKVGGRIAVISFHSGEDRIVKNFLRDECREKRAVLINKKPIVPTREEIISNKRSRSAKLRIATKINE